MARQQFTEVKGFYGYLPGLVAVVTVDTGEERNVMAAAWNVALSFVPPLYGVSIAPIRHTHNLILEAGSFGVNFMALEETRLIGAVGGTSGRDMDKFAAFHIATEPSLRASAPVLADAYVTYECELRDHHVFGDHTLFAGEIVAMHIAEGAFSAQKIPQLDVVRPAIYLGHDYYLQPSSDPEIVHVPRGVG